MQSFNKDERARIETMSKTNLDKMAEIQDYLTNKINWVIKICDSWIAKLDSLEENNQNYMIALQKVSDYVPSELVSDDFRNIDVSPEFSKIGVVMTNLAIEKNAVEAKFLEGFIRPVRDQFNLLKEYQNIISNFVIQATDMCRLDLIEKMKTFNENFEQYIELIPVSNRLRQKLTDDGQKNKKISEKLHQMNQKILENHTTCAVTGLSINKMLEFYKTSCFRDLLNFINTGLIKQVTEVLDTLFEKGVNNAGIGELTRASLDACFTKKFDNEELPVVQFIECEIPPVSVESNENSYNLIGRDICDKIMLEKNLRVKLLHKKYDQNKTVEGSFEYLNENLIKQNPLDLIQSLKAYGTVYLHLFTTKWQLKKLDIEITIYSIIISRDLSLIPELSNEKSLGEFNSLFYIKYVLETWKMLMFGGNIEDRQNGMDIHPVILVCTRHIRRLGVEAKGIFRVNGGQNKVKQVMACLEAGIDFSDPSVNTYASTLKAYFRELRSPPISLATFEEIFPLIEKPKENVEKIQNIMFNLNRTAWLRLRYKFYLLADVASHSDVGNMNSKNLSSVFGMLYCSYYRNDSNIYNIVSAVLEFFISNAFLIFPKHVTGMCYPDGLDYITMVNSQVDIQHKISWFDNMSHAWSNEDRRSWPNSPSNDSIMNKKIFLNQD